MRRHRTVACTNLTDWARANGVNTYTAYRWSREGTLALPAVRINSRSILAQVPSPATATRAALYARVSSHDQKDDLARQLARRGLRHRVRFRSCVPGRRGGLGNELTPHQVASPAGRRGCRCELVVELCGRLGPMDSERVEVAPGAQPRQGPNQYVCHIVVLDDQEMDDDLERHGRSAERILRAPRRTPRREEPGDARDVPRRARPVTRPLRTLHQPFVVAAPTGMRIRTRLHLTEAEASVLTKTGTFLGSLAAKDLADRCALGRGYKHLGRNERKQGLTAATSSRLAGSITAASDDQWQLAFDNLFRNLFSLRDAIALIDKRCAIPTGTSVSVNRRTTHGYPTPAIRHAKQQRLQVLRAHLAEVEQRIETGRVSVVRGGKALLKNRHHLDRAGLSEAEWAAQWRARRLFLTADGERSKTWGNETIRVHPDTGQFTLRLPTALAHLSNTNAVTITGKKIPSFVFEAPVAFSYHGDEWAAQVASGAVSYTITFDPLRSRWYLDASWSTTTVPTPSLASLFASKTLGVDLNADHLAAWVIAPDGNPEGSAIRIELALTGSTERRDGLLRGAVTRLLDVALANGCASVTIENLNFADARSTGRETMGHGKRGKTFRRTVSGMPTAKFRDRLAGMAANRGIFLIAVDPAYTSKWGAENWTRPLTAQSKESNQSPTRHDCAAVVIGRRGKQHRARTTTRHLPARHQRMTHGQQVPGAGPTVETKAGNTGTSEGSGRAARKTQLRESDEPVTPGPTRPFGRPVVHRTIVH